MSSASTASTVGLNWTTGRSPRHSPVRPWAALGGGGKFIRHSGWWANRTRVTFVSTSIAPVVTSASRRIAPIGSSRW